MPAGYKPYDFQKIKPMAPMGAVRAKDGSSPFAFALTGKGEKSLFEQIANEHTGVGGTEIRYYSLDVTNSDVDLLYGEAGSGRAWNGPYILKGHCSWPEGIPEQREEGFKNSYLCEAWISRLAFEKVGCPTPNEGDVLQIWRNVPLLDENAVLGESVPGSGYFFNVVDMTDDAHMFNNPDFAGFKINCRRNTEFTPERRVRSPKAA